MDTLKAQVRIKWGEYIRNMNSEQKEKLTRLRERGHIKEREQRLQNNVLFQECLEAFSCYEIIGDVKEIKHVESLASSKDAEMHSHDDKIVLGDEEQYYIVWNEATLPIVLSMGKNIMECWDDVSAVAFDTYLVSVSF